MNLVVFLHLHGKQSSVDALPSRIAGVFLKWCKSVDRQGGFKSFDNPMISVRCEVVGSVPLYFRVSRRCIYPGYLEPH